MKLSLYYSEQQEKHIQEPISLFEITLQNVHKIIIIPLLCLYGLFIDTCVSANAIVSKDATF